MFNPRENPKVNYGLWVIMICQCRLKKCTILVTDADNGGGYACVRAESMWEISASPSQFCCKPKTALKTKSF